MLPELNLTQWAVLAVAVALVVAPRLGALKAPLVGFFRRESTSPDIHAKVDAYAVLVDDLPADVAKSVWACIREADRP